VRTPGGKAKKGKLKDVRPDDLAALAIQALLARTRVDPGLVEDVLLGCAFPEGEAGMNVARVAALKAGLPVSVPGQTINRFCASGLDAVNFAAAQVMSGQHDMAVGGGVESMSRIGIGASGGAWPDAISASLLMSSFSSLPGLK